MESVEARSSRCACVRASERVSVWVRYSGISRANEKKRQQVFVCMSASESCFLSSLFVQLNSFLVHDVFDVFFFSSSSYSCDFPSLRSRLILSLSFPLLPLARSLVYSIAYTLPLCTAPPFAISIVISFTFVVISHKSVSALRLF